MSQFNSPHSRDPLPAPHLELAHILFIDLVGYSQLGMSEQAGYTRELQALVGHDPAFLLAHSRGEALCRPTGDGMAIVFLRDIFAPLNCAIALAAELRRRPHLRLRMGVHAGPIYVVRDINHIADVQGDGIVMAQRVMDCGDTGHILLSSVAAELIKKTPNWAPLLHEIGECRVKHNQPVFLYNMYNKGFGNHDIPKKVMMARRAIAWREWTMALGRSAVSGLRVATAVGLTGFGMLYAAPYLREIARKNWAPVFSHEKAKSAKAKQAHGWEVSGASSENRSDRRLAFAPDAACNPRFGACLPNVIGDSDTEVARHIQEGGCKPLFAGTKYNDTYEAGSVFEQTPKFDGTPNKNNTVHYFVSKGPDPRKPLSEPEKRLEFTPDTGDPNAPLRLAGTVTLPEEPTGTIDFAYVLPGQREKKLSATTEGAGRERPIHLPTDAVETSEAEHLTIRVRAYQDHVLLGEFDCAPSSMATETLEQKPAELAPQE